MKCWEYAAAVKVNYRRPYVRCLLISLSVASQRSQENTRETPRTSLSITTAVETRPEGFVPRGFSDCRVYAPPAAHGRVYNSRHMQRESLQSDGRLSGDRAVAAVRRRKHFSPTTATALNR